MFEQCAEYSGQYRSPQGNLNCHRLSRSENFRQANEPRLKQISWPKNRFGKPVSIHELLSGAAQLTRPSISLFRNDYPS